MITLRDYQLDSVQKLVEDYNLGKNACVISPTASGKTLIIKDFVKRFKEKNPKSKICLAVHRLEILNNLREIVDLDGVDFQTIQKLNKSPHLQYDALVIDECFDGETEVLTDGGFIPFKFYREHMKVAQWSPDGSIEFVEPKRTIRRFVNDKLNKIELYQGNIALMTDGHRQPYFTRKGRLKENTAVNIGTGRDGKLPVSGTVKQRLDSFGIADKLKIYLHYHGRWYHVKERDNYRVKAVSKYLNNHLKLIEILNELKIKYEIYDSPYGLTVDFETEIKPSKKLSDFINIGLIGLDKARDTLDYIIECCGKNVEKRFNYQSSNLENIKTVQALCAISGYQSNLTKSGSNQVLSFSKRDKIDYRSVKHRGKVDSVNFVYCVEVPSSYFIARTSSGFVFVTGNCHHVAAKSYRNVIANNTKWHSGFTGTPLRGYMPEYPDNIPVYKDSWKTELTGLVNDELYSDFILTKSTRELIELGYLSDYEFVHDYDFHIKHHGSNNQDYTKNEIDAVITAEECVDYVNSTIGDKKGIVFCHAIDFAEKVAAGLGNKAVLITSKTSKIERNQSFEDFRNGIIDLLVNVDIFSEGVDVPAVDCVYLFRPTRSIPVFFQQIGRALRLSEGKTKAIIYDYVNNLKRLGVEPKDVELKDMLLTGKFVKESCEYCGAYGVIEGNKDKLTGSIPNDYIRQITHWLSKNEGLYYVHYGIKRNDVQFKLRDDIPIPNSTVLDYYILFHNTWFKMYRMPVILNQYYRWEVMNNRNLSYAIDRANSDCLKMEGSCKYSDKHHDYFIVMDNMKNIDRKRVAKIK